MSASTRKNKKPDFPEAISCDFRLEKDQEAQSAALKQIAEWQLKEGKIRFFFELILISLICAIASIVLLSGAPTILKAGAGAALYRIARAFVEHITYETRAESDKRKTLLMSFLGVKTLGKGQIPRQ